jgi:hypothetical protein
MFGFASFQKRIYGGEAINRAKSPTSFGGG